MSFLYGLLLGYVLGLCGSWNYFKDRSTKKITIHMDAKEAADFIESDEAVKELKKEMKW